MTAEQSIPRGVSSCTSCLSAIHMKESPAPRPFLLVRSSRPPLRSSAPAQLDRGSLKPNTATRRQTFSNSDTVQEIRHTHLCPINSDTCQASHHGIVPWYAPQFELMGYLIVDAIISESTERTSCGKSTVPAQARTLQN